MSEKELKQKLTPEQYRVTQENGTETAFKNEYWDNHRDGIYVDVVSGEPLFASIHKYDSGSGWPAFTQPLMPENIVEKIVEGQINKFFGEICLLEQVYVIDTDMKVGKVVEKLGKDVGAEVKLAGYVRYQLGEGIEKKEDDFAAEVASLTK